MSYQQLRALMEAGEELGCVNMSAFTTLLQELELDEDEIAGLYETLEREGHRGHRRLRYPGHRGDDLRESAGSPR